MKNRVLFLFVITAFLLGGCKKTIEVDTPPQLLLEIVDENNNPVANAEVELFATQQDFNNRVNIVAKTKSNSKGEALFSENLEEKVYFFFVFTKKLYNKYGVVTHKTALLKNEKRIIKVTLENKI